MVVAILILILCILIILTHIIEHKYMFQQSYFHNGISCTGKIAPLYWNNPLLTCLPKPMETSMTAVTHIT